MSDDAALLKDFLAEVSEVERDNEVNRILSCFKLNPFEHLNLPFDSSEGQVKKNYRKVSLMVHPDKCKHPKAREAFDIVNQAQQKVLDPEEREYLLAQFQEAKEAILKDCKKQVKKDPSNYVRALVQGVAEGSSNTSASDIVETRLKEYQETDDFKLKWKLKVREILTSKEWRRRKMAKRMTEEEGRIKQAEEEEKKVGKRKQEHHESWEKTRETRVSSWRDFQKGGKKVRKGETKPPKLKEEDAERSYVQRPVKRG